MKRTQHSFTLVEILMVAGMIALVAAIVIVSYNGIYRSWSTGNTVGAMKCAHLAIDRHMLETGTYPIANDTLGKVAKNASAKLVAELKQDCSPYSYVKNGDLLIYDDFGPKPPKAPREIYYKFPIDSNTNAFMLMSMGKDGSWGGDDDIIYLPFGWPAKDLKPGFYMATTSASGGISGEIEPIAQ
ncbi:MAG: type II secretion system protein [Lentisphaerae bacterium]|nr:type II secretion system protein [Lentisphaerota bacterium]